MVRWLAVLGLAAALGSCDTFRDYKVRVEDPTRQDTVQEPTYYDYQKRDTIHQRPGTYSR
ncbi:MAG TPA: hypothetical protein VKA18_01245 [Alphaproteobacteria bacterium]|nr:hypothetical protein [Alphaproteobacteria bacterium]